MKGDKSRLPGKKLTKSSPSGSRPTVVGIGASAGGPAALKRFFENVPSDSGLAFVVVVHLSPEHKSHLADLLQPSVRFPVQQVTENVLLEANNVYVIPPNANLDAIDTHLRLSKLEEHRRQRAPIDHFFRTLASTHDGHAIGIVLTGTGSDGTLGLKEIKAKGGLIVVQEPNEAEFDAMPQSAIATGLVDLVLPLAEMPDALIRYLKTEPRLPLPEDGKEAEHAERILLPKILAVLKSRTDRDFSRYKSATILRRIARRMQLNYIEDFNRYTARLRENPEETRALADDLLITVTSFFRDSEVFQKLESAVIPKLFENKTSKDVLRVWSVGCATGEEAYSLAMILLEEAARREAPPQIQIFASDLHKRSLESAREGIFSGDIETDVNPERLKRFFVKENGGYRIRKEVRDLVVFAPHSLLGDPPFLRINLISCRNLLIYLDRSVQRDVIDLFHYALYPDGYLMLGSSESVDASSLFRTEDKKLCLYRKRNVPAPEPRLPVFPVTRINAAERGLRLDAISGQTSYRSVHQDMLERFAPPSILVGPDDQIIHLSEHGGRFLIHPGGAMTASAVKSIREELRTEFQALLRQSRDTLKPHASRLISVRIDGHAVPVFMHARPSLEKDQEGFVLVMFIEHIVAQATGNGSANSTGLEPGQESERIVHLESELTTARQHLQATIEEFETSREEMKATNEELRSTMEEVETSKEELQSINEELQTVNQENRHKVEELSQLSSDLQNLLAATEIATLFLDRDLRIMRFTPRVAELFNIRVADRGRPISDLTHRLGYEQLRSDAESVLGRLVPIEREIQDDAGRWYLSRVLPYRSAEDRIDGLVLTFIDITSQKNAETALRSSALELFREGTWLRTMLDSLSDGIIGTDNRANVTYLNPVAERLTGWLRTETVSKQITDVYDVRTLSGDRVQECHLQKSLKTEAPVGRELFILHSRHGVSTAIEEAAAAILMGRQLEGAIAIVADITERAGRERQQKVERDELRAEVHRTTSELGQTHAELRALSAHLIKAQEEERRRLARELHDDFSQRMAILSVGIDRALEQIRQNPDECVRTLQDARDEASRLNQGLRETSHRLHPSVLEDLGLVAALRSLITGFGVSGNGISFHLPDDVSKVNPDAATALYRITQEALRNATKHAVEASIHVNLVKEDGLLKLSIRDDGPGFDLEQARLSGGLGLLSMQERSRLANGTFGVKTHPGEGTAIEVHIPVHIA